MIESLEAFCHLCFNGLLMHYVFFYLQISNDYYFTSGVHKYFNVDIVFPGETAYGTITFLTPEFYPHCLYEGKVIPISEGEKIVGYATIMKVLTQY